MDHWGDGQTTAWVWLFERFTVCFNTQDQLKPCSDKGCCLSLALSLDETQISRLSQQNSYCLNVTCTKKQIIWINKWHCYILTTMKTRQNCCYYIYLQWQKRNNIKKKTSRLIIPSRTTWTYAWSLVQFHPIMPLTALNIQSTPQKQKHA